MKKNKSLIIILILLIGVVGITIAYFSNTTSIDNLFSTKEYGSTITEVFESPDNWLPGTSTDKSISVTNSGEVDGYKVRLLNGDELFTRLGYDKSRNDYSVGYVNTSNVPNCLYNSNYSHWTMSNYQDSTSNMYIRHVRKGLSLKNIKNMISLL